MKKLAVIGFALVELRCTGSVALANLPHPNAAMNDPATSIKAQRMSGEAPHLPDLVRDLHRGRQISGLYKICVGQDGQVSAVTPIREIAGASPSIISTVMRWRYQPQVLPFCFIEKFDYTVN